MMRRPGPRGFTLMEVLMVFAIISIFLSVLLPAILGAREASRRTQCENNLKQIMLAIQNYGETFQVFPPGVVNESGPIANQDKGYHVSWAVQLLPYMEQSMLASSVDTGSSIYSPANWKVRSTFISILSCPSDPGPAQGPSRVAQNSYAAVHSDVELPIDAGNSGVFFLNSKLRYEGIPDGTSQTIFVGEKPRNDLDLGWVSGTRATLRNTGTPINSGDLLHSRTPVKMWGADGRTLDGSPFIPDPKNPYLVGGFGSHHEHGANFGFGDGSVRFVSETVQRDVYRRLANRADGEMISDGDF